MIDNRLVIMTDWQKATAFQSTCESNLGCKIDTWYWAIRNFDLLFYMATIWTWNKCSLSSTVWPVPSTPDHVTWSVTLIMMVIIIKRLPLVHNRRPDCMRWPAFIKNETIFSFATGGKHSIIGVESSIKPTHINISIASPVIAVASRKVFHMAKLSVQNVFPEMTMFWRKDWQNLRHSFWKGIIYKRI